MSRETSQHICSGTVSLCCVQYTMHTRPLLSVGAVFTLAQGERLCFLKSADPRSEIASHEKTSPLRQILRGAPQFACTSSLRADIRMYNERSRTSSIVACSAQPRAFNVIVRHIIVASYDNNMQCFCSV